MKSALTIAVAFTANQLDADASMRIKTTVMTTATAATALVHVAGT